MDSNTHSTQGGSPGGPAAGLVDGGLAGLAAAVDELAAQELEALSDAVRAERVLGLRRLVDRLEGQGLKELAGAGAGQAAASPASWLRNRLRLGAG